MSKEIGHRKVDEELGSRIVNEVLSKRRDINLNDYVSILLKHYFNNNYFGDIAFEQIIAPAHCTKTWWREDPSEMPINSFELLDIALESPDVIKKKLLSFFLGGAMNNADICAILLLSNSFCNGIIKVEMFKWLGDLLYYHSNFSSVLAKVIVEIVTSKNYEDGLIPDKYLQKIYTYACGRFQGYTSVDALYKNKWLSTRWYYAIRDVLTSENYKKNLIPNEYIDMFFSYGSLNCKKGICVQCINHALCFCDISKYLISPEFKGVLKLEEFYIPLRDRLNSSGFDVWINLDGLDIREDSKENCGLVISSRKDSLIIDNKKTDDKPIDEPGKNKTLGILGRIGNKKICDSLIELFESGSITEGQIEEIINVIKKQDGINKIEGLVRLLTNDIFKKNNIKYEDIKFMLDDKYEVFRKIIDCILRNNDFSKEVKGRYILTLLNIESKDKLCNLCDSYIEDRKVKSLEDFSSNFILYVFPSLALFKSSAPKKRVKKLEELGDKSHVS